MPYLGSRRYQLDDLMWDVIRDRLRTWTIKDGLYYLKPLDVFRSATIYSDHEIVDLIIESVRKEYLPNSD